jgi:hypothetical protein
MPDGSTAGHDPVNLDRGLMRTRLRATRPLDQVCNCCLLVKRRAETVSAICGRIASRHDVQNVGVGLSSTARTLG